MIDSVLRAAGYKTGLFTSPHLVDVRERIRIDGKQVEKDIFLRHLWNTLDTLQERANDDAGKPAYFRFLTLLCFQIFLEQNVDVAILEVGLGGRLDATNCVRHPVVCGVTALGFDHMDVLGGTLPQIAREKAGIFKPGCPAFTVPQREDAAATLREVASKVGAPLRVVPAFDEYTVSADVGDNQQGGREDSRLRSAAAIELGLAGEHQRQNAALAVCLAAEWEEAFSKKAASRGGDGAKRRAESVRRGVLPPEYVEGLQTVRWPGRGQIVVDPVLEKESTAPVDNGSDATLLRGNDATSPLLFSTTTTTASSSSSSSPRLTFFLDGAHTPESMDTCARWFASATAATATPAATAAVSPSESPSISEHGEEKAHVQRVLLFNCMQERDGRALLEPLVASLAQHRAMPHHALFVPPDSMYSQVRVPPPQQSSDAAATKASGGSSTGYTVPAPSNSSIDLAWQLNLRSVWERLVREHRGQTTACSSAVGGGAAFGCRNLVALPPVGALGSSQNSAMGAVLPNLQTTVEWLRRCAREAPSLRLQVLVTGSLYMVGDLLRLLGRAPS
jgi:folylpolyglutamate synthase